MYTSQFRKIDHHHEGKQIWQAKQGEHTPYEVQVEGKNMNQLEENKRTLTQAYLLTNVSASSLFQGIISQTWRPV